MDTLKAYCKAQVARASGNTMTYFDGVKIKSLMKEHKVKEADIFLSEDRFWTNTTVKLVNNKLIAESMGVDGSIWATPILEIDGREYDVGTKEHKNMTIKFINQFI